MKRFIFLPVLFMMCLASQAQIIKPNKVHVDKKPVNTVAVGRMNPKKSGPLTKKIITTHISIQASELKQKKQ